MKEIGKLEDGKYICELTQDECDRLKRYEGSRKYAARSDAKFSTIANDIEAVYRLPSGSVVLKHPDNDGIYRRDAKISTIRRAYGE